jgi:hypothetical protein
MKDFVDDTMPVSDDDNGPTAPSRKRRHREILPDDDDIMLLRDQDIHVDIPVSNRPRKMLVREAERVHVTADDADELKRQLFGED